MRRSFIEFHYVVKVCKVYNVTATTGGGIYTPLNPSLLSCKAIFELLLFEFNQSWIQQRSLKSIDLWSFKGFLCVSCL